MPLPPQSEQQPKQTETYHQSLEATKKRPEPNPLSDECYLTICYFLSQQVMELKTMRREMKNQYSTTLQDSK